MSAREDAVEANLGALLHNVMPERAANLLSIADFEAMAKAISAYKAIADAEDPGMVLWPPRTEERIPMDKGRDEVIEECMKKIADVALAEGGAYAKYEAVYIAVRSLKSPPGENK